HNRIARYYGLTAEENVRWMKRSSGGAATPAPWTSSYAPGSPEADYYLARIRLWFARIFFWFFSIAWRFCRIRFSLSRIRNNRRWFRRIRFSFAMIRSWFLRVAVAMVPMIRARPALRNPAWPLPRRRAAARIGWVLPYPRSRLQRAR